MLDECFGPLLVFCLPHLPFFSGFVKDIVSSWIPKCRVPVNRCEKSWLSYFKHGTTALSDDHTDTKHPSPQPSDLDIARIFFTCCVLQTEKTAGR